MLALSAVHTGAQTMFRRKEEARQFIPWYRERSYKGNLTEEEKRELDSYRWMAQQPGGKHPAAEYGDLAAEVQSYISKLEIELYDKVQGEPECPSCFPYRPCSSSPAVRVSP